MYARSSVCLAVTAAATASLFGLAMVPTAVLASDVQPDISSARVAVDKLGRARSLIAEKKWSAALEELRLINDTNSADWNNLMGFCLRKKKTPDLTASETYYDAALSIDPHHRGTLEYSGELYLMKGDLAKAQTRLASLKFECGVKCQQYAELDAAIASFKANGNKYVTQGSW